MQATNEKKMLPLATCGPWANTCPYVDQFVEKLLIQIMLKNFHFEKKKAAIYTLHSFSETAKAITITTYTGSAKVNVFHK